MPRTRNQQFTGDKSNDSRPARNTGKEALFPIKTSNQKRHYSKVIEGGFPEPASLNVAGLKAILKENDVPFGSRELRASLLRKYHNLTVDHATTRSQKRLKAHFAPAYQDHIITSNSDEDPSYLPHDSNSEISQDDFDHKTRMVWSSSTSHGELDAELDATSTTSTVMQLSTRLPKETQITSGSTTSHLLDESTNEEDQFTESSRTRTLSSTFSPARCARDSISSTHQLQQLQPAHRTQRQKLLQLAHDEPQKHDPLPSYKDVSNVNPESMSTSDCERRYQRKGKYPMIIESDTSEAELELTNPSQSPPKLKNQASQKHTVMEMPAPGLVGKRRRTAVRYYSSPGSELKDVNQSECDEADSQDDWQPADEDVSCHDDDFPSPHDLSDPDQSEESEQDQLEADSDHDIAMFSASSEVDRNCEDRHLQSLTTAELRSMAQSRGFPCRSLSREQLIKLCQAINELDQQGATRSGNLYKSSFQHDDPTLPTTPPSSVHPEVPNAPRRRASGNLFLDEDYEPSHNDISCRAMHHRTAVEIENLKNAQREMIARIDEGLRVIHKMRDDQLNAESTLTKRKTSSKTKEKVVPRSLRKLLRQHCAVLLGWTFQKKEYPQPATLSERSHWGTPITSPPSNAVNRIPPSATPQQMEIIQSMLREAGVNRFAPNFLLPQNAAENAFLWTLAVDIFLELVKCGDYRLSESDQVDRTLVRTELRKYVKESLARTCKQKQEWPKAKLDQQVTYKKRNARRNNLVERRLGVVSTMDDPDLEFLYPVIQAACSEDETDNETLAPDVGPSDLSRKRCLILAVPWRSEQLSELLSQIDATASQQQNRCGMKPSGPAPRIRHRLANPPNGNLAPKAGLPRDCYNQQWLQTLSTHDRANMKMGPSCGIRKILTSLTHSARVL